ISPENLGERRIKFTMKEKLPEMLCFLLPEAEKASFEIKVAVTVQDEEGEAEEGDFMVEEHQYSPAADSSNDAVVLFPLKNGDEIQKEESRRRKTYRSSMLGKLPGKSNSIMESMTDPNNKWYVQDLLAEWEEIFCNNEDRRLHNVDCITRCGDGYGRMKVKTAEGDERVVSPHRVMFLTSDLPSLTTSMHVSHLCNHKHLSYEDSVINQQRRTVSLKDGARATTQDIPTNARAPRKMSCPAAAPFLTSTEMDRSLVEWLEDLREKGVAVNGTMMMNFVYFVDVVNLATATWPSCRCGSDTGTSGGPARRGRRTSRTTPYPDKRGHVIGEAIRSYEDLGSHDLSLGSLDDSFEHLKAPSATTPRVRVTRPNGTLLASAEERGRQGEAVTLHVHELTEEGRQNSVFGQLDALLLIVRMKHAAGCDVMVYGRRPNDLGKTRKEATPHEEHQDYTNLTKRVVLEQVGPRLRGMQELWVCGFLGGNMQGYSQHVSTTKHGRITAFLGLESPEDHFECQTPLEFDKVFPGKWRKEDDQKSRSLVLRQGTVDDVISMYQHELEQARAINVSLNEQLRTAQAFTLTQWLFSTYKTTRTPKTLQGCKSLNGYLAIIKGHDPPVQPAKTSQQEVQVQESQTLMLQLATTSTETENAVQPLRTDRSERSGVPAESNSEDTPSLTSKEKPPEVATTDLTFHTEGCQHSLKLFRCEPHVPSINVSLSCLVGSRGSQPGSQPANFRVGQWYNRVEDQSHSVVTAIMSSIANHYSQRINGLQTIIGLMMVVRTSNDQVVKKEYAFGSLPVGGVGLPTDASTMRTLARGGNKKNFTFNIGLRDQLATACFLQDKRQTVQLRNGPYQNSPYTDGVREGCMGLLSVVVSVGDRQADNSGSIPGCDLLAPFGFYMCTWANLTHAHAPENSLSMLALIDAMELAETTVLGGYSDSVTLHSMGLTASDTTEQCTLENYQQWRAVRARQDEEFQAISAEPRAGPSKEVDMEEPQAGPSGEVNMEEPQAAGPSGDVNMEEPQAGPSGEVNMEEPQAAGPSGEVNMEEPQAGPSGDVNMEEPQAAGPSGEVNMEEPQAAGPSGEVNMEEPQAAGPSGEVNMEEPQAAGPSRAVEIDEVESQGRHTRGLTVTCRSLGWPCGGVHFTEPAWLTFVGSDRDTYVATFGDLEKGVRQH
ncbi:hypothetical protein Bbelb_292370, partial [Branchiostoma belcheri]